MTVPAKTGDFESGSECCGVCGDKKKWRFARALGAILADAWRQHRQQQGQHPTAVRRDVSRTVSMPQQTPETQ